MILHESQQTEIIHWLIEVNSTRLNYKAFVKHSLSRNFIITKTRKYLITRNSNFLKVNFSVPNKLCVVARQAFMYYTKVEGKGFRMSPMVAGSSV